MTPDHEAQRTTGDGERKISAHAQELIEEYAVSVAGMETTDDARTSQAEIDEAKAALFSYIGTLERSAPSNPEAGERERLHEILRDFLMAVMGDTWEIGPAMKATAPYFEDQIFDLLRTEKKPEISGTDLTAALAKRIIAALWSLPGFIHHDGNSVVQDVEAYARLLRTEPGGEAEAIEVLLYVDEAADAGVMAIPADSADEAGRLMTELHERAGDDGYVKLLSRPTTPVEPDTNDSELAVEAINVIRAAREYMPEATAKRAEQTISRLLGSIQAEPAWKTLAKPESGEES